MRIAIIGSRGTVPTNLAEYLADCDEIVSGGAKGVDACAAKYAKEHNIPLKEFMPEYKRYGRGAPIVRNRQIVDYADHILAFWDGKSKGTQWVIKYAEMCGKPCTVIRCESDCP